MRVAYFDDQTAVEFFNGLRKSPWIMAGGVNEGCHYRAHVIAGFLQEAAGEPVKKAWCWGAGWMIDKEDQPNEATIAFGPSYDELRDTYEIVNNYHVAAILERNAERGGGLAFDPVYYDGPVALAQWQGDFVPIKGGNLVHTITGTDIHVVRRNGRGAALYESFGAAINFDFRLRNLRQDRLTRQVTGRSNWLQECTCRVS